MYYDIVMRAPFCGTCIVTLHATILGEEFGLQHGNTCFIICSLAHLQVPMGKLSTFLFRFLLSDPFFLVLSSDILTDLCQKELGFVTVFFSLIYHSCIASEDNMFFLLIPFIFKLAFHHVSFQYFHLKLFETYF